IELTGDSIDTFMVADFKLPQTALRLIPKCLANTVASLIKFKPGIDTNICRRCNLCKTTCPVGAIEIRPHACTIDYNKCVRCLCCHEVCPYKAIKIKRNILAKLVWG
ncbi:MAG: 4Fe-4S binding protein, partial [Candidatus Omnitrophica bacterium]|nr:4Fe-4S binding protein [Candidatus Omnitrophota bacterium]